MESIGQPIHKDYGSEIRPDPDLRTLDELLSLAEVRIRELEKRVSYLEGQGRKTRFVEILRPV